VAAELTMIIQINATVCAAVDHGEGEQLKIAGRDQRKWRREIRKGAVTRRDNKSESVAEVPVLVVDAEWHG
jgi:hypothetical protein